MNNAELEVRVKAITLEAEDIVSLDLRPVGDRELPACEAGSHLDIWLPNGVSRSYSLTNAPGERHRYVVAVHRDAASRGGSRFIHETLRVGQRLGISKPKNAFALVEDAAHVVLIAGGIGITPMYGMAQRLSELGRHWRLFYATRSRDRAAFLSEVTALSADDPARLTVAFGDDDSRQRLDIARIVADAPEDAHIYCCGPKSMLDAFELATKGRPPTHVHVERFAPKEEAAAGGFTVVLAKSGTQFVVPEDKTILDMCIENGIDVPYSCMEGVCGSCETAVIEGTPDHRDTVLSDDERKAGQTMMICRSGCKGNRLVLDL